MRDILKNNWPVFKNINIKTKENSERFLVRRLKSLSRRHDLALETQPGGRGQMTSLRKL